MLFPGHGKCAGTCIPREYRGGTGQAGQPACAFQDRAQDRQGRAQGRQGRAQDRQDRAQDRQGRAQDRAQDRQDRAQDRELS